VCGVICAEPSRNHDRDGELRYLVSEDLARVHDIIGVDGALDCTHDTHLGFSIAAALGAAIAVGAQSPEQATKTIENSWSKNRIYERSSTVELRRHRLSTFLPIWPGMEFAPQEDDFV
jgi:hypothetical protein